MTITDQASRPPPRSLASTIPPARHPALAGNKAATLAVLRRAGFGCRRAWSCPPTPSAGGDELPPARRAALARVPDLLGPGPWAVRSSSTAEDTEQASFAGQFETVLGVEADGLADAVLRVWRSGHQRVKAYAGGRERGRWPSSSSR